MARLEIPTIKIENLSAAIGGKIVVADANLTISPGEKIAIVGTNGAGKSTFLRAIAGIDKPVAGQVLLDDQILHNLSPRQRAKLVSFVSQEETPAADLRVDEMVALSRIPHRPAWAINDNEEEIVLDSLKTVGLEDYRKIACDRLSGGEKRRAMIARGLAQNCPILMLDEPTNHLDVAWTLRLLSLLSKQATTVIVAIHDIDLVLRYFDYVVVIHEHKIWAYGKPIDVINSALMSQAFKVKANQFKHPETHNIHLLITQGED